jgi:hypothetical protein
MTDKEKPEEAGGPQRVHDLPARTGLDDFEDRAIADCRKAALLKLEAKIAPLLSSLGLPEYDDPDRRDWREFLVRILTESVVMVVHVSPAAGSEVYSLAFQFRGETVLDQQAITGTFFEICMFAADVRMAKACEVNFFVPATPEAGA